MSRTMTDRPLSAASLLAGRATPALPAVSLGYTGGEVGGAQLGRVEVTDEDFLAALAADVPQSDLLAGVDEAMFLAALSTDPEPLGAIDATSAGIDIAAARGVSGAARFAQGALVTGAELARRVATPGGFGVARGIQPVAGADNPAAMPTATLGDSRTVPAAEMADFARVQRGQSVAQDGGFMQWLGSVASSYGAAGDQMEAAVQPRLQSLPARIGFMAGNSLPQTAAVVGGSLLGGPVGGAVGWFTSFALEGGNTIDTIYKDLRAKGYDEEEALLTGFAAAAPAGAVKATLERGFGVEALASRMLTPAARAAGASDSAIKNALRQWAASSAAEAATEPLQGTVDRVARYGMTGQGPAPLSGEAFRQMGQEAVAGGVLGGLMGAPVVAGGAVGDYARSRGQITAEAVQSRLARRPTSAAGGVQSQTPSSPQPRTPESPQGASSAASAVGSESPAAASSTPEAAQAAESAAANTSSPDFSTDPTTLARIDEIVTELQSGVELAPDRLAALESELSRLRGDDDADAVTSGGAVEPALGSVAPVGVDAVAGVGGATASSLGAAADEQLLGGGRQFVSQQGRNSEVDTNGRVLADDGRLSARVVLGGTDANGGGVAGSGGVLPARAAETSLPAITDLSGAELRARARELGVDDRGPISAVRRRIEALMPAGEQPAIQEDSGSFATPQEATRELDATRRNTTGEPSNQLGNDATKQAGLTTPQAPSSPQPEQRSSSQNPTRAPSTGRATVPTATGQAATQEAASAERLTGPGSTSAIRPPLQRSGEASPIADQSRSAQTATGETARSGASPNSTPAVSSADAADIADIQRATGGMVRVVPATTPMQKKLEGRMKGLGRRVVFVEDSSGTFNGAASTNDSRTVYVRADADDATAVPTVAHELLHAVAREAPDVVEKVVGTVSGERLAAARAKYRGRLASAFGEDSRVVKNFDKDEKLATEEAVAQIIEDAAEGDADAARMLYETPGLLQRLRQIVRRLLDKMGVARLTADERAFLQLMDRVERNGDAAVRKSVAWASNRIATNAEVRRRAAGSMEMEARGGGRDSLEARAAAFEREGMADATTQGWQTETMFAFKGTFPAEVRAFLEGKKTPVRRLFSQNNPNGTGADAISALGEDAYFALAMQEAGTTDPAEQIDALRRDPDPENQLVAAVAMAARETGKTNPKMAIVASALQPGDIVRINNKHARVLKDEDERMVLVGEPFRGIYLDGLRTIPVDAGHYYPEGTRRNVEAVQAMGSEATDVPSGGGSRGAVLDSDVPFSPRSMFDRTDDSKGTGTAQGSLFGIPADAVAKGPPKLSPAELRELYPGIRVGETVAKYEKRMGTADTPVMFSPRGDVPSWVGDAGYKIEPRDGSGFDVVYPDGFRGGYYPTLSRAVDAVGTMIEDATGTNPQQADLNARERAATERRKNRDLAGERRSRQQKKQAELDQMVANAIPANKPVTVALLQRAAKISGESGSKTVVFYRGNSRREYRVAAYSDAEALRAVVKAEAANQGDPANPGIRPGETVAKYEKRMGTADTPVMFAPRKKAEDYTRDLIALHNTTVGGLRAALRLGGIPGPSMAIVRKGMQFDSFGDVTLVGKPALIDPAATSANKVYPADAYSPRQPRATYVVDKKAAKAIRSKLDAFGSDAKGNIASTFDEEVSRSEQSPEQLTEWLMSNTGAAVVFVRESGGEIVVPRVPFVRQGFATTPEAAEAVAMLGEDDGYDTLEQSEFAKRYKAYMDREYAAITEPGEKPYSHDVSFRELDNVLSQTRSVMRGETRIDSDQLAQITARRIKQLGGEDALRAWAENLTAQVFPGENFLQRGRRKEAYTLENVTDAMFGKGVLAQEKSMVQGLGNARAAGLKPFSSIPAIHEQKGRLVSREQMNAAKKENEQAFGDFVASVRKYHYEGDKSVSFAVLDDASRTLGSILKGSSPAAAFARNGFTGVPSWLHDSAREMAQKLKDSPTEYFEAKPKRAVRMSEFAAVVTPQTLPPDIRRGLESAGVAIVQYNKGDPAARAAAVEKAAADAQVMFAPRGISRIEQRGAEQAQREIDRGAKKLESERAKAEAQRASARATITTLRDQLGAAMRREKGLTRVVGILETMRARQEARADEATAENQARAQAMKQMRETQREVEQVKDELVRIIRDALPRTMHAAFITDIQKVRSRQELPYVVAKIETAALKAEALALDEKMQTLTGVSNTSKLTDPETIRRVVGDKGNKGKLRKLSGIEGTRAAATKAMEDFVKAADKFNTPGADSAAKREALALLELAYQNLRTIVQEQRVADRLLTAGRRQNLFDAVNALAGRLSTLPVRTAIRRLTKTVGQGKMGAFVKLADAETMMMLLDGKLEGGDFYNRIYEPLRAAMNRQFEIVDAMMTRADGHARRAGFKDQADMEVRLFGLAGDANAISYDLPVEIGGTKKIPASQALKLYAMDQETLADTTNGRAWKWDDDGGEYTIDWKQYDALVKAIPAEHRALVDALKADRDTLFPKFAQTVKILTGTEPPKVFGYDVRRVSPRWMRQNKIDTPIQTGPTGHIAASLENVGMGKARVSTKAPLLATNFYGDWKQSVDMQSRVIELATPIRDAKMMIRNGKVADAIAAKIHPDALERLERMLDDVAGVNQRDPGAGARIWATLGRNVGKSLTQLNVQSWLRNTAGIATLAPEMPAAAFADGLRGMFSTKFADMMQESAFLRRMYGQNVVAMKSVQAYEGSTPDARGPGALGTAGRGIRIAAMSSRSAGQNLARAVMQQPGAWQSAMEDMHNAMKAGGSITDGIGVMHWFASLPARIAYAGWKAEAARRGENADWAMKQMEQSLRRTQGMNDALMMNGLQSQFRGTYMQPFFMFTNDSVRMANMAMRATMSGDRAQQARVAGAIAVSAALGSVITAALGREGLRALLNDDEDEREKARQRAAETAAWTFARDTLGIIAPGVTDRLVESVQAIVAPSRGVTATDAALGNPVVSIMSGTVGAIAQATRGAAEMVQGDDGRGNTGSENVASAMERFTTGILRLYGSPIPSIPSQVRRVTGAGE